MPLFTANPVVASDGTTNHNFTFIAQQPGKQIIGEYVEKEATSASGSKLIVKHDVNTSVTRRRLFSRRINVLCQDGVTLKPVTINYSIAYDKDHDMALVKTLGHNITVALVSKTEFYDNWVIGSI